MDYSFLEKQKDEKAKLLQKLQIKIHEIFDILLELKYFHNPHIDDFINTLRYYLTIFKTPIYDIAGNKIYDNSL